MMMRKLFTLSTILSTAMILTACGRSSQIPGSVHSLPITVQAQSAAHDQVQLIVRFRKDVTRTDLLNFSQKYQLQTVSYQPQLQAYIMVMRAPVTSQAALNAMVVHMQQEPAAAMVEVNHTMQTSPVFDMTTMPVLGN